MSDQDELTPEERSLEDALRSLRPAAARRDFASRTVRAAARSDRQRNVRILQFATAATVLGFGAGIAWMMVGRGQSGPEGDPARGVVAAMLPVEPPTELDYRRALLRSAVEFDALLDRQATMAPATGEQDAEITRVGVVMYWRPELQTLTGAL